MAQQSLVVTAGLCRLYLNNKIYPVTQSVSVSEDTGEYSIYGINSIFPQEIAGGGKNIVKGSAGIVRVKNSGGLQGVNAMPLFSDKAASSYISIRLEDRSSGETLWSIPKAKIVNIKESVAIKGKYNITFDFIGQIKYGALDLA